MNVWIVIPAFNEAQSIGQVVSGCFLAYPLVRVVVVSDGSQDTTAQDALAAGAHVVAHEINRGQGAALQTGTRYALAQGADVIVHFDADNQFDPHDIGRAIALLREKNVEVVLGSRFLSEESRALMPWSKRVLLFTVGRLVNWCFTGVWLTDVHNGFRVLTRKAAECILITHDRMAHNSEIVRQIRVHKLSFVEMPTVVRYHEYGQGVRGGIAIIKDLLIGKLL